LGFISNSGSMVLGGASLFALGLGMGIPLLIIGTTGHLFLKAGAWMDRVKQLLGIVMLGVAVFMLARIIPPAFTLVLWAALAISAGIILGALRTAPGLGSKISKALGLVCCIYGIALSLSLINGNTNPLRPWVIKKTLSATINFVAVKSVDDVKQQIATANGKPVMLDFYADWCVACKEMDRTTFTNPEVQRQLQAWIVLRADVTANDAQDKALAHFYKVVAPPTLIFFNTRGEALSERTLVGKVSAAELVDNLKEVK
ncbi:MAG TPA: thioredoxin family protein, partial [Coxiellaceae bacterium]|nr:thioredoxin family protein [Coxiellaceae bacterium]